MSNKEKLISGYDSKRKYISHYFPIGGGHCGHLRVACIISRNPSGIY